MKFKTLKRGLYTTPQLKDGSQVERYVIENESDLSAFFTKFPKSRKMLLNDMLRSLSDGLIIIATDEHWMSGHPTYCFESPEGSTHPSSFIRVKLL